MFQLFDNKFIKCKTTSDLVPNYLKNKTLLFSYTTKSKTSQPALFESNFNTNVIKKNRKFFKLKSERGVFAPFHKLSKTLTGITSDEKEFLSNDRSCYLLPETIHELSMHTGQEYRSIPSGSFKPIASIQRGYDYFRTFTRGEDPFFYEDGIFFFKKNKLGEYIFTKRTGSVIHVMKKKK